MRAEIRSKFECTRAQDFPFFYGISQPFKDVDSSGRETRAEQGATRASAFGLRFLVLRTQLVQAGPPRRK